ncbi:tumor necrosis factor-like [Montipora foliosa]|uniref:tumor necrosis factor-like n=1 Tax=Montipora foliosa TaxID=591990 RepID=UPI0035F17A8C
MKLLFVFFTLACANLHFCGATSASGNQDTCVTSNSPININVHGKVKGEKGEKGDTGEKGEKGTLAPCNCTLQNDNKPSAHLDVGNTRLRIYHGVTTIKGWSVSSPNSHLAGGMTYNDGKLTVPISGRYYIYLQIYYYNNGRVYLFVNNKYVTMTQPMKTTNSEGTLYAGGVFKMKAGDVIMAKSGSWPTSTTKLWFWTNHCYFGAFLI